MPDMVLLVLASMVTGVDDKNRGRSSGPGVSRAVNFMATDGHFNFSSRSASIMSHSTTVPVMKACKARDDLS